MSSDSSSIQILTKLMILEKSLLMFTSLPESRFLWNILHHWHAEISGKTHHAWKHNYLWSLSTDGTERKNLSMLCFLILTVPCLWVCSKCSKQRWISLAKHITSIMRIEDLIASSLHNWNHPNISKRWNRWIRAYFE